MESYPIIPLATAILALTGGSVWFLFRKEIANAEWFVENKWKLKSTLIWVPAAVASIFALPLLAKLQQTDNVYYNELQANGTYKFFEAFKSNELDYKTYYPTISEAEAEAFINKEYNSGQHNFHEVVSDKEEKHWNIVLVTLESMSAEYMERFGNDRHLTPFMDSLALHSMTFDNLFATGNRTVRGLEAVTLSLPPCPGQSIIKQAENQDMNSTSKILREKGYDAYYFYGGNSYFDNMSTFFGGNGYNILDHSSYKAGEKPFFAHIMSISNHRPFTSPEGKISIPADSKSRAGGVMYSDYALGEFIRQAQKEPWFSNTIFVITADHCASSAGSTELPLHHYHIPAMIYAPGIIEPEVITKVASQIYLMPTLFAIMGLNYDSYFYGKDVKAADFRERAFVATYQSLGYLEDNCLTIISPTRHHEQFDVNPNGNDPFELRLRTEVNQEMLDRTIAFYQTSTLWNKR